MTPARLLEVLLAVIALLAGVGVGRLTASAPAPVTQVVTAPSPVIVVSGDAAPAASSAACEEELEALRTLRDLQDVALHGRPASFDEVTDRYRPETFERNLREATARCQVEGLLHLDCSEYPCAALFDADHAYSQLMRCEWWREQGYGVDRLPVREQLLRDGERVDFAWLAGWADIPFPGGEANQAKRLAYRQEEWLATSEELLDARPRTEREKLLDQRRVFEDMMDRPDPPVGMDAEGIQWQLDVIDRKLRDLEP